MKYSVVKQFSNGAIDNIFNFFFKWVDFGKMLLEAFWAFVEIWQAFFGIFYNLIMYVYYLLLFMLDRGAEDTSMPRLFAKPISGRLSSTPALDLSSGSHPSAAARTLSSAAASVAGAVSSGAASIASPQIGRNPRGGKVRGKERLLKRIGNFFVNMFSKTASAVKVPAAVVAGFFVDKIKPVKEEGDEKNSGKRSLIEDYMQEYEKGRR